jgi:hypothetical protein
VFRSYNSVGLDDFWTGYFASRAYPLGNVPAEVVTATFFTFHPEMVHRALPRAWAVTTAEDVAESKLRGTDAGLRRMLGDGVNAPEVAAAADLAAEAIAGCDVAGRPLFAAYAALPWPDEAHLRLWHAAAVLREHRGDGHIAASLAHGLNGLAALVTHAASGDVPVELSQRFRGWSAEEWEACQDRLVGQGLIEAGHLTQAGRALRSGVEDLIDELAAEPWERLGEERTDELAALMTPIAQALFDAGVMRVPNPIGAKWARE